MSVGLVTAYHFGYGSVPASFGVLTFFVISGFLITFLLLKERQKTGTISLKQFYVRRSLRIFPAFYVFWIIVVGGTFLLRPTKVPWGQAVASFFYVANYYQGLHGYPSTLLSHTWSLGVEEQFYLLWPGVFLLFRNRVTTLARGLCVLIPMLWVYRILLVKRGVADAYIYTSFETRVDAILVGCLLAIVLSTGLCTSWVGELRRTRYLPVVLVLLVASVFGGFHVMDDYKNVVGFAVDPVLVAILILQLTSMKGGAWMDWRPLAYLGQISYSTYLYQVIVPIVKTHLPYAVSFVGCFIAIWIMAALSYELVEKPFLRLKKRLEVVKVPEPGVDVAA